MFIIQKALLDITLIHQSLKFKNVSKYVLMCPTVSRLCFVGDAPASIVRKLYEVDVVFPL
jgi:hypothetical protein